MSPLPEPFKEAIFYEDERLYITLANFPKTKGHTVVVWKEPVTDLHLLNEPDYDHLMDRVNDARNALMKTLGIEKVYLVYMDEAKQVHWHLFPRYNESGFDVFEHESGELKDFSLAQKLKQNFTLT